MCPIGKLAPGPFWPERCSGPDHPDRAATGRRAPSSGMHPASRRRPVDTPLAERRLADRLAIVGTLLPAIAHELGTPLGVVLARARLIETGALSPGDEARSGGIIAEQVARMSQVIRRLLDFSGSRPGETANGQEQVWIPLRALVDNITEMLRPVAHRRQITLRLRIGPPIVVRADACLLQQALVNLLIKLIQEMRGPGELHLTLARRQATPPSLRQGDLSRPYALFSAHGPPGSCPRRPGTHFPASASPAASSASRAAGWSWVERPGAELDSRYICPYTRPDSPLGASRSPNNGRGGRAGRWYGRASSDRRRRSRDV